MKLANPMSSMVPALLAGLIVFNLHSQARAQITFTGYAAREAEIPKGDFAPEFLSQRLGLAQKYTSLNGMVVHEKNGHKLGKLDDLVIDLRSGHVLCGLVTAGVAGVVAIPGRVFCRINEKEADLAADIKPNSMPRATGNMGELISALPDAYNQFEIPLTWTAGTTPIAHKCSELMGIAVQNSSGESLGRVVNFMVDLPTARVVFAIISFGGKGDDLYAVPMKSLQPASDKIGLVLNTPKATIEPLAHSDAFFWSNMADATWAAQTYRTFGQHGDFEAPATALATK